MKWDDNLLLDGASPVRGQLQLAAYALHLSTGAGIHCRQLKLDTIKQYVFAAASFLALFSNRDFRKDNPSDSNFGHLLGPVFDDLKKYETVPERREPYTMEMHAEVVRLATQYKDKDNILLVPSLADQFAMGVMAGYRLSEWAQHAGNSEISRPALNHLQPPQTMAICPRDMRAESVQHARLEGLSIVTIPLLSIRCLWIKFKTQKNGHHGEERLFTRNTTGGHCFVAAAYRSLVRFKTLQERLPCMNEFSTPLACYWDPQRSSVQLITATEIEALMRRVAALVYHMHPKNEKGAINKWSAHSLRVGACVALHSMGFSPLDIQWLLRWRSQAFMAYLRNLALLADRQHQALDKANAMPHMF